MNTEKFPWLALGIGLALMVILGAAGAFRQDGQTLLPLLTLLIVAEFGFIVTLIGAVQAIRRLLRVGVHLSGLAVAGGCSAMALAYLMLGIFLWPGMSGAGAA